MGESLKKLRIFSASPSDVASERTKLETVVDSLKPMADYLGLILEVVDWRVIVPDAGRPQQVIFDQLKPTSWDIFIGILWHRFGTPPGATDKTGKDYLSGTEEEFKTAYELWRQHGKPRMVLYRCTRALPFDVDPDQLKNVRAFFKLVEDVKGDYPTLYQTFDTTESFEKLVLNNLQKLLVEYGKDAKTPITPEVEQVLAPKIPNNLPRRQAFFGRTKEMDVVMRALSPVDRTWGVLVDGIGGIGKSAIAIEAAYRAQEENLFDVFVFVTSKTNILDPSGIRKLAPPAQTLDEFLNETAHILGQSGIAKLTGDEKRRALIDVLRSMRTLLIYDNLETLSKEEQEGIANFLRELPQGCKAIITSRRRGGEGGVWLRVEKLDWDAARGIIENEMARDTKLADKLHLFELRWQELFDETNGSPLALVHALGLMRVRVVLTFDYTLEMLRGNRDEDLQNFIFQEARKELTENDKVALGALSFFVPASSFEAWMQVANLSRNALETTIDRLNALSLVDMLAGQERYALHPLTRAFVRNELLTHANLTQEIGMRFALYWVNYAERYGGEGEGSYKTYECLEAEWANLDATANWLWDTAKVDDESIEDKRIARILDNLINSLRIYLWFSGRWDERVKLCTQVFEIMIALQDWSSAGWHAFDIYKTYLYQDVSDLMMVWAEKCIYAWERGNDKRGKAMSVMIRATMTDKDDEFIRLAQSALAIWGRETFREQLEAIAILGMLAAERKEYVDAERFFYQAVELANKYNDIDFKGTAYEYLGEIALERGNWVEARKQFEQAFVLAKELGRIELKADAQYGLARVHEAEQNLDLALPLAQDALKIFERLRLVDVVKVRELVEMLEKKMSVE